MLLAGTRGRVRELDGVAVIARDDLVYRRYRVEDLDDALLAEFDHNTDAWDATYDEFADCQSCTRDVIETLCRFAHTMVSVNGDTPTPKLRAEKQQRLMRQLAFRLDEQATW